MKQRFFLRINVYIFVVSLFIHFVWEVLQSVFYTCSNFTVLEYIPLLLMATFGDGLIMVLFYWIGYFKNKNPLWIFNLQKNDYYLMIIIGFLSAIVLEIINLNIARWSYNALMPLIPIVNVGIIPIIQLMLLPFVIFWVVKKMFRK